MSVRTAADLLGHLSILDAGAQEDRQDVQKAMEEMQHPTEGRTQAVMLRRMQLAQADALITFDLAGSVRGALQLACQRRSQQEVLEVRASTQKNTCTQSPASPEVDAATFPCSITASHAGALCRLELGAAGSD